jgi:uncharacterized protein (DUF433 family)
MQLEDYFEFLAPDDIRIKGTRIGIETVLYEYLHRGQTPEAISNSFPSLRLELVYATILYFLHKKEEVSTYVSAWLEFSQQAQLEQDRSPTAAASRLQQLKAEREAGAPLAS